MCTATQLKLATSTLQLNTLAAIPNDNCTVTHASTGYHYSSCEVRQMGPIQRARVLGTSLGILAHYHTYPGQLCVPFQVPNHCPSPPASAAAPRLGPAPGAPPRRR